MKTPFLRTVLTFGLCIFVGPSLASAQASRTWVSGVGDDVNPCSRTAPCKTFAGAISKTAAGGEISVLDPGGYGSVQITKSMTISGVGEQASILAAGTNGITINAGAGDTVTLRNLQINGVGSGFIGIRHLAGGSLVVDDVRVFGFETGIEVHGGNATVFNSVFSGNRVVGVNGRGGTLTVEGSMISNNNIAVIATAPGTVRVSNNSLYNNLTGFGCGGGILASTGDNRKANIPGGGTSPTCPPTTGITLQ